MSTRTLALLLSLHPQHQGDIALFAFRGAVTTAAAPRFVFDDALARDGSVEICVAHDVEFLEVQTIQISEFSISDLSRGRA